MSVGLAPQPELIHLESISKVYGSGDAAVMWASVLSPDLSA